MNTASALIHSRSIKDILKESMGYFDYREDTSPTCDNAARTAFSLVAGLGGTAVSTSVVFGASVSRALSFSCTGLLAAAGTATLLALPEYFEKPVHKRSIKQVAGHIFNNMRQIQAVSCYLMGIGVSFLVVPAALTLISQGLPILTGGTTLWDSLLPSTLFQFASGFLGVVASATIGGWVILREFPD